LGTTSVIVAIAAALVIAAYYYIPNAMTIVNLQYEVARTFLILFAAFMSFTSVHAAIKHRFFAAIILEEIRKVEAKLKMNSVPMWTRNAVHPREKNRFWEKWSADVWLIVSLIVLAMGLLLLCVWNVYVILIRLLG
jgi:hypothetical protein